MNLKTHGFHSYVVDTIVTEPRSSHALASPITDAELLRAAQGFFIILMELDERRRCSRH